MGHVLLFPNSSIPEVPIIKAQATPSWVVPHLPPTTQCLMCSSTPQNTKRNRSTSQDSSNMPTIWLTHPDACKTSKVLKYYYFKLLGNASCHSIKIEKSVVSDVKPIHSPLLPSNYSLPHQYHNYNHYVEDKY